MWRNDNWRFVPLSAQGNQFCVCGIERSLQCFAWAFSAYTSHPSSVNFKSILSPILYSISWPFRAMAKPTTDGSTKKVSPKATTSLARSGAWLLDTLRFISFYICSSTVLSAIHSSTHLYSLVDSLKCSQSRNAKQLIQYDPIWSSSIGLKSANRLEREHKWLQ